MKKAVYVQVFYGILLGVALFGVFVGAAIWHFGCFHNLSLYLNGHDYIVEPMRIDVGRVSVGEKRTATIHIRNFCFKSIRIVGLNDNNKCVSVESLPVVISPRENRELELEVALNGAHGNVEQMAVLLFEDDGNVKQVPILITGKCINEKENVTDSGTKS